ncbi:MAG: hypothetical protein ACTSRZ_14625 [Promethearchaeota archaeon]
MEQVLGVIEDLIEKFKNGSDEEKEDSKASLKANKDQFISNLQDLANSGNADAKKILDELKSLELD